MKNSPDPLVHRRREQQFIEHVERLLGDERLRLDTTRGNRSVAGLEAEKKKPDPGEKGAALIRLMADLNLPDRELQKSMPLGESMDVTFYQTSWWVLRKAVGRLRVVCVAPTKALLKHESPEPMSTGDVQKLLASMPPPPPGGVPVTLVLLSTSGFTIEAREVADRRPDRTVILVEPNDAGGWTAIGPAQTKALADLFDPEAEEQKRRRVREFLDANKADLLTSGVAAEKIASKTQLPPQFVEQELKAYAKENPGLASKRLDGRVVLYREGASLSQPPAGAGAASTPSASGGGSPMPLLDSLRALFGRKGENEKKISFLSERRAALSQQADRAYEDMAALEQQEAGLRQQFKDATGALTKRRVTSQLLQLRKDIERRQQLLTVLNQQINVVSTHLHSLELVQQGRSAQLPDAEEMTADAVKAEEMLAELEAGNELAGTTGSIAAGGMTAEEQALFEELERESGGAEASATKIKLDKAEPEEDAPAAAGPARTPGAQAKAQAAPPAREPAAPVRSEPRRSEPEPG